MRSFDPQVIKKRCSDTGYGFEIHNFRSSYNTSPIAKKTDLCKVMPYQYFNQTTKAMGYGSSQIGSSILPSP